MESLEDILLLIFWELLRAYAALRMLLFPEATLRFLVLIEAKNFLLIEPFLSPPLLRAFLNF
jgi:hypothetical protein